MTTTSPAPRPILGANSIRSITQLRKETEYEAETKPLDFGLIRRLFRYTRPYARKRNVLLLMVLLRSVQLPGLMALMVGVIKGPINHGDVRWTVLGTIAFVLLAASTQLTFSFRQRLAQELGEAVMHDLRRDIFDHLQTLSMSFYGRTKLGRIISRMTSDVEAVRVGVQDVLFISMVQVGQGLVAAGFMLWYDPMLFLLVLAMAPALYAINRHFRKRLSQVYREIQESFSRVTATLAESVSGIRVTQGFVRQDVNAALFHELVADHSEYNMAEARTRGVFLPLLDLNNQLFIAAMLLLGAWHVLLALQGHPGVVGPEADAAAAAKLAAERVAAMAGFFFMAGQFFGPIGAIGQQYNNALTAMAGAERVFKLLDTPPDLVDPPDAVALPPLTGQVEFRAVDFEYVPGKRVLHDISFHAQPGQTIALVGHTGSGKTTIVNLIAKFYLPNEGQILVDGYDLTTVSSASLHRQMGIVLQVNFLFSGTVLDNIRVGKPDATDAEVTEAARQLDCLDLFEALPNGLLTQVGERGSALSLGQRQLVCFTRAMLADPRILVLDEATSSVDAMTEARVQAALKALLRGRTSFVVAHRLSTIRHADLVLVLDHGRIVERGTHKQLLATGGVYAHLYRRFIRASEA